MLKASVKTNFSRGIAYEKKVIRGIDPTTREIADSIVKDIRASWSPESPSEYGTAPAKVSGDLDRSIKRSSTGRTGRGTYTTHANAVAYEVTAGVPYAGVLEDGYLFRPFFEPALERAAAIFELVYRRIF
jgi:hypothetical protein